MGRGRKRRVDRPSDGNAYGDPSFNSIPSPPTLWLDVPPSFRVFVPAATTSTTDSKSFCVHLNLDVRLPTIADGTTRRFSDGYVSDNSDRRERSLSARRGQGGNLN